MRADPAGEFTLREAGAGRLRAEGALTFATARRASAAGLAQVAHAGGSALTIDCAGVSHADSAGLAVLIEWVAAARAAGGVLAIEGAPAELRALARISEVGGLLGGDPAP